MRMRVIIEVDHPSNNRAEFSNLLRDLLRSGTLGKVFGPIVYVATEPADTSVVTHTGTHLTARE